MSFIEQALRTEDTSVEHLEAVRSRINIRLKHGVEGLVTEIGEIFEAFTSAYVNGTAVDIVNAREEAGDCYWYLAILSDELGVDLTKYITSDIKLDEELLLKYLVVYSSQAMDLLKKADNYGKVLDETDLVVKLAQLSVVLGCFCVTLGTTPEAEKMRVINKLSLRYPDKFTSDKAINRDTVSERELLEKEL